MDKKQDTKKQESKSLPLPLPIIIVLVVVLLLVMVGVYVFVIKGSGGSKLPSKLSTKISGFDMSTNIAYSNDELYTLDSLDGKLWLYGYYYNDDYYILLRSDPADEYSGTSLDVSGVDVSGFTSDDLVLVSGEFADDGYTFVVSSISAITTDDIVVFNTYKYPYADIEITDHPSSISQGCEFVGLTVKIKNTGRIPIVETDFYTNSTELPKYRFIQIVDGKEDPGYSYSEETDFRLHGYSGLGTIEPGESKTLEYGAGGYLSAPCDSGTSEDCWGRGGAPNSLCHGSTIDTAGARELQLAIGYLKPGSYTEFIHTSESNTVSIDQQTCECDLSAP